MPRARNPNRDKAYQIWLEHNGSITNRQIAEMLGESEKVVAVWKQRDKWNVVQQSDKSCTTKDKKKKVKPKTKKEVESESSDGDELTPKQRIFVKEYLVDLNATQAAIRAGYSKNRSSEIGYQLLQKTTVREAIEEAKKHREKRIELSQDKVIQQLARIAFADIKDVVNWDDSGIRIRSSDEIDGTIVSEISEVSNDSGSTVKIKLNDRMKALMKLYDHLSDEQRLRIAELQARVNALGNTDEESAKNGLDKLSDIIEQSAKLIKGDS